MDGKKENKGISILVLAFVFITMVVIAITVANSWSEVMLSYVKSTLIFFGYSPSKAVQLLGIFKPCVKFHSLFLAVVFSWGLPYSVIAFHLKLWPFNKKK